MFKCYKNAKLTAGMLLAGLAGTVSVSAGHSVVAHASTVVANKSANTSGTQKNNQKTLSFTTAKAESADKGKNAQDTKDKLDSITQTSASLSKKDVDKQVSDLDNSTEKKNFDQVISDAKNTDGVQVIKDADVWHTPSSHSEEDAKKDYQTQAENLKKQIDAQKQKLNDYKSKKQEYDKQRQAFIDQLKQEGLWQEGTVDPSTLAQSLVIKSEPQAEVKAEVLNNQGKLHTLAESERDGLATQEFALNNPKTDAKQPFLKLDYSNLKNSSFNGQAISRIELTFSNAQYSQFSYGNVASAVDTLGVQYSSNPINGFTYRHIKSMDVHMNLYGTDGKLIDLTKAPAYLTVGSLNTGESVQLLSNGSAVKIPESSINIHANNTLYADKNNDDMSQWSKSIQDKYKGWDNNTSPNYIFGAGLYKLNAPSLDLKVASTHGSAWFIYSTTVPQISFDAKGPQKPTITIHYHDNKIKALDSVTVKYIDEDTGKEIPNTEFTQDGNEGDAITYTTSTTIDRLKKQNYVLVKDGFTGQAGNKISAQNNGKTYTVILKKKTITPEIKQGTQTYHFVDKNSGKVLTTNQVKGEVGKDVSVSLKVPDGYKLVEGQKVPTSTNIKEEDKPINILVEKLNTAKPSIDSLTAKYIDADTGKEIPNTEFNQKGNEGDAITYSTAKTIKSLQLQGYTLVNDGFTNKAGKKLSPENNGKTYVVTLKKVKSTPEVPKQVPHTPTPSTPKSKEKGNVPDDTSSSSFQDSNIKADTSKINQVAKSEVVNPISQAKASASTKAIKPANVFKSQSPASTTKASELPQTGDSPSTVAQLAGASLLVTTTTLGIAYTRKKRIR